jgi:hypothetical protein
MTDDGELKELQDRLKQFKNSLIKSAGIRSKGRQGVDGGPSSMDNAEIIEKLVRDNRDFFTPDRSQFVRIIEAGQAEIDRRLARLDDEGLAKLAEKGTALWTATYKAIMKEWLTVITENIEDGKTVNGAPAPLSASYRQWKQAEGYGDVIGKLTGQLIDNLSPDLVSRNIVFKKD